MFARLIRCFWQLFPSTYRARYWDADHRLHFSVWKMWLGRCYDIDDVVVCYDAGMERKCMAAVERGEYQTLDEVLSELKTASGV